MTGLVCCLAALRTSGDPWIAPRRGSWVETKGRHEGDFTLVRSRGSRVNIVVGRTEPSNVMQAARFLAADIQTLTGARPLIVRKRPFSGSTIELRTLPATRSSEWESYSVDAAAGHIKITGSNPRGTAFGVYELSERLGIDPLYRYTGVVPQRHTPLILKEVHFHQPPPAVRFRGFFHDDEDVLPRPLERTAAADGLMAPAINGTVSLADYKRYFETALRLKLNMVAPWVRTNRYFEVQKTASEWGLFVTSHHYDTLLSDPYHFTRPQPKTPLTPAKPALSTLRQVRPEWDFVKNRDGMIRFWKGGVDENHSLDCIWPVGLRGTNDYSYKWPINFTQDQILREYEDAIRTQTQLVKSQVGPDRPRLFHFTMYTEMLPYYQTGRLHVPDDVIIVWPDDNDGHMRGLPSPDDTHRHGVYYHLAYLGGNISKQSHQVVPLNRIESEFRKVFRARATEFMLVNVSELREYVMGARFLADICWNGEQGFSRPDAADRFLNFWCTEYFGAGAAATVAQAYKSYFASVPNTPDFGYGAAKCLGALSSLEKKLRNEPFTPAMPETLPTLIERTEMQASVQRVCYQAETMVRNAVERRFLFENLSLAAAMDRLPTLAAVQLVEALSAKDKAETMERCRRALVYLDELQTELQRANRPPFEGWYGPSWTEPRDIQLVLPRYRLSKLLAGVSAWSNGKERP